MARDEEEHRENEEPRRSVNGDATAAKAWNSERPRSERTAMLICFFGVLAYSVVMQMMSASTQTSGVYEGLVALGRNYTASSGTYELMWNNSIASERISAMSEIGIGRAAKDLIKAGQDVVMSATGLGAVQSDAPAKLPVLQPDPSPPPSAVPLPTPPPPPPPAAAAAAAAPAVQAVASRPLGAQGSQEGKDSGAGANGGSGEQEECVGVDGSEEGDWDKSKKYHLRGCKLRRVTAEEARECFRDKTIVWVGDSVTRFQFLSLVNLLAFGSYPGPPTGGRRPRSVLTSFKPWPEWFAFANNYFNDTMWCNCYRPQAGWLSPATANQMVENRYYSLDSHNISFNLLTAYGNWKMHGHYPPPCTGGRKRKDSTCSMSSLNRDSLRNARHKFTKEEFDGLPALGYDWEYSMSDALKFVVPNLQPDLLYLNFGAWSDMHKDTGKEPFAKDVFQAAQEGVCSKGAKCIWKRTTYFAHSSPNASAPPDTFALKYANQLKWDIFNASEVTRKVYEYKDAYHFLGPTYNELNNMLLNMICPRTGRKF